MKQLDAPDLIFKMFAIDAPDSISRCAGTRPSVTRELPVPQGHIDHRGRLDLWVRFGDRAIICIEVKIGLADTAAADTEKQRGYRAYLDQETAIPTANRHAVLLVTYAKEPEYPGKFKPLMWSTVCIRLRNMLPLIRTRSGLVVAAMVLAFVGAVEQNLLRFSAARVQQAWQGAAVLVSSEIREHILKSLDKEV